MSGLAGVLGPAVHRPRTLPARAAVMALEVSAHRGMGPVASGHQPAVLVELYIPQAGQIAIVGPRPVLAAIGGSQDHTAAQSRDRIVTAAYRDRSLSIDPDHVVQATLDFARYQLPRLSPVAGSQHRAAISDRHAGCPAAKGNRV